MASETVSVSITIRAPAEANLRGARDPAKHRSAGTDTTIARLAVRTRTDSSRREMAPLLTGSTEVSAIQDRSASSTAPP